MSQLVSGLQKLWRISQSWREPYKTLVCLDREVATKQENEPGSTRIFNWEIAYANASSLRSMFRIQFIQAHNDFFTKSPQPRILDCGSNIGISVLRYKQLYPQAQITAIEPDARICELLRQNLRNNHYDDVEVVEAAVWISNGHMRFTSSLNSQSGYLKLQDEPIAERPVADEYEVRTIDLRDYLSEPVDFIKLDIEGAELDVLMHCRDLLRNVREMSIEVHHKLHEPQMMGKVMNLLGEEGFQVGLFLKENLPDELRLLQTHQFPSIYQYPLLLAWRA